MERRPLHAVVRSCGSTQLPRTQEHNGPLLRRPESHLAGIRALGMRLRPHTRCATSNHLRPRSFLTHAAMAIFRRKGRARNTVSYGTTETVAFHVLNVHIYFGQANVFNRP